MRSRLIAALLVTLPACADTAEPRVAAPSASPPATAASGTGRPGEPGALDRLTITLELDSPSVEGGGTITSRLTVANESGRAVVERDCAIGAGRYALVPADEPDAELWLQPVVDCAGRSVIEPGYRKTWEGPEFLARTKHGDDLPPGDYVAALEIDGYSQRLEQTVEVTE